jgi:hypothetical protein
MGLLAGLIWELDPSAQRDRLNGIFAEQRNEKNYGFDLSVLKYNPCSYIVFHKNPLLQSARGLAKGFWPKYTKKSLEWVNEYPSLHQ